MRIVKYIVALVMMLGFGSCDIERTYYFVEAITIEEIPNFAQDANEANGLPDVFIEITDFNQNLIYSSPYLLNVQSNEFPLTFVLDNVLELGNADYHVNVYDFDDIPQGNHEFLGGVIFPGKSISSTYYSQYNDPALSGTIGVTIDMLVERE